MDHVQRSGVTIMLHKAAIFNMLCVSYVPDVRVYWELKPVRNILILV